ncbi:enterobactin synthase subunit F [Buttiauxella warmboldiae]|uniref:Enterobactin synthase subunit F n=1 Tax=Buttiauxella warmboldiae TaxID=82993 RepID=A0A3N5EDC4_9ENTR|nr:enterobactin synthase subunit F [Buttiauxella warmboldiae]RPH29736.1 enterobactin synthase subunit F [Buttiauxella warmboldiae]
MATAFEPPPETLPLAAAQPGIWMADRLSPQANAWSVAHYVELNGELNEALLCQAIVAGMKEADTLCMRFGEVEGEARQWIDPNASFTLPLCRDLRAEPEPEAAALALMRDDLEQDLRLASGRPLYHHQLLRINDTRWLWYQRFHHLVVDGFSFTAITRRIANIYRAFCAGQTPEPSPFTPFSDVVEEYQQYRTTNAWQRDCAFWLNKAQRLPPPATLSAKPLSGQGASSRLIRQSLRVERADFQALVERSRQQNLTAADMALGLVALWLGRLSGRAEYCAGFIFMRRLGSAALCATGPVLNVLPFGVRIEADFTLEDLAANIAGELKSLRRYQRYDAEQIQRDLGQVVSGEPLYGAVLNLKMFDYRLDFHGIEGITHQLASGPVRDLEIALYISEQGDFALEILANAERYDAQVLQQHIARLPLLLRQFAANPALRCVDAELLHISEIELIERVNDTQTSIPATTLSQLIAQQANRTPNAPALADENHQLSYREMRQQVQALARELISRGVKPGDVVAVALPRSVFLSLALQAIVEVGAAWLPLDTGYPDDRLQMMLEDAAPRLLLTSDSQLPRFSAVNGLKTFCYQSIMDTANVPKIPHLSRPEHTAYVIFTSGSTGRPKGVMVGQQAIVNRLLWMQNHYPLNGEDVVLQKTPCSFDVSVWEFFWPYIVGAQLVMAPPEAHRDPEALQQLFARYGVTTTHFVPSMLAAFVAALTNDDARAKCGTLCRVFCSGEALPTELCRQWEQLTYAPLHNLYGPTEAAVDVSWYPAFGEELARVSGSSVPIGWPVWNTGLRILDSAMRPVPPGIAGDLYLTGIQLAQGYLSRPDLTASRFVADPFAAGERMYRTGDVGRWLDDGAVEYLGRSDDQLKIRGQRIELGDIDRALQALPDVAQAVTHAGVLNQAAASGGDARQLVGYLVSASGQALPLDVMREKLCAMLPAHMVPVALVQLDSFPLSANGKLDRKALPLPEMALRGTGRAPESSLELTVADSFAELLGCEIQSVDDDFFALGGHSLLAMRLAARLRQTLAQPVSVGQVMVASTVGLLAETLAQGLSEEEASRAGFDAVLPLRKAGGPTLYCFHPASGFAWQFSVLQRYLDPHWSITGIQSPRPYGPMQQAESLDRVCEIHLQTLRELQPHGPYYLMGYSLGGTIAQGIAARLEAAGEEVAFLGLLDTWPPETQNWAGKGANELDPLVLDEINREREAFVAAQQGQTSDVLFQAIEGNYGDAVRLLTTAHSVPFAGKATLFVAERTLPQGMDPQKSWAPWIAELEIYRLDYAHVDIISPNAFVEIGPVLQRVLA